MGRGATAMGLTLLLAAAASAQPRGEHGDRDRGDRGRATPPTAAERAEFERRLHERLAVIVQRELKLTADQTQRLGDVTRRFEAQRRPLYEREFELRRSLRQDLSEGATPDQQRVDGALRELLQLQRRRIDVVEAEQRELARFLTPVQRAQYMAIQENVRARVDQQRGRGGPPGPVGPRTVAPTSGRSK